MDQVKIILVETSHPGNIGSAARAMKTMGLSQLVLVSPKKFPDDEAVALASGAGDVLENAQVVPSFEEAVADCQLIIGSGASPMSLSWPKIEPRAVGLKIMDAVHTGQKVAIVFGRERIGLLNEELHQCHYHLQIPANAEYSSLNLAQAVQVICYEIRMAYLESQETKAEVPEYAKGEDIERFYAHLESVLVKIEFLDPENPRKLMPRMRRLFQRTQLEETEVNILRGICKAVEKKV